MPPDPERERRIVDVIVTLQRGEVVTYGDIAAVAGYPRQSRLVGRILSTTELDLPWWRVVNAAGRLVPGHEREQSTLLREEDVIVRNGHVRRAPHGRFSVPGPERSSVRGSDRKSGAATASP